MSRAGEEGMAGNDLYAVLGVDSSASDADIKKAYKKLAMKHHPDRRQSSPHASESAFQEISNAYNVLSDPRKRSLYDMGGTNAVEEHEGMEHVGVDQLMLNILMWEPRHKIAISCLLLFFISFFIAAIVLVTLKVDYVISLSWFWTLCPLWLPLALFVPVLVVAPCAIYAQAIAAGGDEAAMVQARAGCVGCILASALMSVVVWAGAMLTDRLDGHVGSTFVGAVLPIVGIELVLALAFLGAAPQQAASGLFWKLLRVSFVLLVAAKLDGPAAPWGLWAWLSWPIALAPLQVGAAVATLSLGLEVAQHQIRAGHARGRDHTHDDGGVSQYAHLFFGLRSCLLVGAVISLLILSLMMEQGFHFSMTTMAAPFLASILASYVVLCCALFLGRPGDGASGYQPFQDDGSYTP